MAVGWTCSAQGRWQVVKTSVGLGAGRGPAKLGEASLEMGEDPLSKFAKSKGVNWHRAAQDRGQWGIWEDEFVAKRW